MNPSINPDFENRAVRYFRHWATHEFSPIRTNTVAIAGGLAVPLITWAIVYSYTGDPLPWATVLFATVLYIVLVPLLVMIGRSAAIRAGAHVARIAEQLTHDLRRAAGWDFLVSHFHNIHPSVVHTSWFQDILRRAAAQCGSPASRAMAGWLASLPAEPITPVFEPPPPPVAALLREQGLNRLRWLQLQVNNRALAAANRVRSHRIFHTSQMTSARAWAILYLLGIGGLAFWSFITASRPLNIALALSVLVGLAILFGNSAIRSWRTGVAHGPRGLRWDRRFSPVGYWVIVIFSTVVTVDALIAAAAVIGNR